MNEKSLSVLEQYGVTPCRSMRVRGGMAVLTEEGYKLLYECSKSDGFYERENMITKSLYESGFRYIDTYVTAADGGLFSQDAQGRRYVLKNWFDARECDVKNITDITAAARTLAVLHDSFDKLDKEALGLKFNNANDLRMKFDKHTKEMRMASNYLKNKKNKNEFEMLIRQALTIFYQEAACASEMLSEADYGSRIEEVRTHGEMCHGSYTYHSVLLSDGGCAVTDFEHCCIDCRITDLYQFMRKMLEKNNWKPELGDAVIGAYSKVRSISSGDMKLLKIYFTYPEKFWKIVNFYNNSNKSWIPRKSHEKLQDVLAQNAARQNFLQTLH